MNSETTPRSHPVISAEALAQLGDGRLAYVKAIRSEDVPTLFPQAPDIAPRHAVVRSARGRRHADHARRQPRAAIANASSREPKR